MRRDQWQRRPRGPIDPLLRSWLLEPGSLTARCQEASDDFRVRLLACGKGRSLAADLGRDRQAWVREVVLECAGRPVIFAHTALSTVVNGRLSRWLAGLGSRSLGSLLFAYPGFRRGAIELRRLDGRDPLFRRAAALAAVGKTLWARRSWHRLGRQEVLVTEVFLPALSALVDPGGLEERRISAVDDEDVVL